MEKANASGGIGARFPESSRPAKSTTAGNRSASKAGQQLSVSKKQTKIDEFVLKIHKLREEIRGTTKPEEAEAIINKLLEPYIIKKKLALGAVTGMFTPGPDGRLMTRPPLRNPTVQETLEIQKSHHDKNSIRILIGEFRDKYPSAKLPERWCRYFPEQDLDSSGMRHVPTKEEIAAAQKELAEKHNLQINIPPINIDRAE